MKPIPFLKNKSINVPVQKCSRLYELFAAKETSCGNGSIAYFDDSIDNSILDAEGKVCGIINIPIIEITFDNDHTHVLHYLPNQYIYGYYIS